jgi:hypothetical protein
MAQAKRVDRSSQHGLQFSDHKPAIDDNNMAEIDRLLREIREVFYSSSTFQGLGVMHPWHRQELSHLITICKETMHGTPTGELLQTNAEQLRLEMGLPGSFTDAPLPPTLQTRG